MPLEKQSGLEPAIFPERLLLSNERMLVSIKASMEYLEEEVSVMAEILEALQQELIMGSKEVTT